MLFEKVLLESNGSARHEISMRFSFFGLMQFNALWIFVGVCGSNRSRVFELRPDQASEKGTPDGPKAIKAKDSAKVGTCARVCSCVNEIYINRLELFWICNISSIQQPARPNQASDQADASKAPKSTDGEKVKDPGLPRSFYINGSLETWSVTGCYW